MPREPKPFRVTITRHYDKEGRRCPADTPGAKPRKEKSDTYYARHPTTRKPVSLKTDNLGQAWVEFRKLQKTARELAHGITDPYTEHAIRPVEEHLDDWIKTLRELGTDGARIALMAGRLRRLIPMAKWRRLGDISEPSARLAIAGLAGQGRSAQTRNHYLSHLRQWIRWCVADRRLRDNPLLLIRPGSVEEDRRHDRRSPDEEEVAQLFAYLNGTPGPRGPCRPPIIRCGMTGPQRALGYKVCMATGLRARELRTLDETSFELDAGDVVVRAAYSKRRRADRQSLPPWLVRELREWFAAGGGVWSTFPQQFPGRVLKADMKAAGVVYETSGPHGPLFFDFHSLRHWYVTQVANQPGLSLKTLLTLTRHSNPELALKVYAKTRREDVRAATDKIPPIGSMGTKP